MIYRSKAPLRLGLAGGGTDVSPFSDLYGGAIINATINLYAYASITPRSDGKIVFRAVDRDQVECYDTAEALEVFQDTLPLHAGVYNRMVKEFTHQAMSFELVTTMDAPAGSGLGTSSTLVVAIIGAFSEWLNLSLEAHEIAQLAYSIEREDLKMAGGKQDQYAATFGGINFMEFDKQNKVIVNPLRLEEMIIRELEHHLLLFYTAGTRDSAEIIERQKLNVTQKAEEAVAATLNLKDQAFKMKEALMAGALAKIGEILDEGWQNKKHLAQGISNSLIDHIYEAAIEAGASGGKISGAGGGGFIMIYCPGNSRYDVVKALEAKGVKLQRYNFVDKGLTTWTSYQ